jgi:hypothetical protein
MRWLQLSGGLLHRHESSRTRVHEETESVRTSDEALNKSEVSVNGCQAEYRIIQHKENDISTSNDRPRRRTYATSRIYQDNIEEYPRELNNSLADGDSIGVTREIERLSKFVRRHEDGDLT